MSILDCIQYWIQHFSTDFSISRDLISTKKNGRGFHISTLERKKIKAEGVNMDEPSALIFLFFFQNTDIGYTSDPDFFIYFQNTDIAGIFRYTGGSAPLWRPTKSPNQKISISDFDSVNFGHCIPVIIPRGNMRSKSKILGWFGTIFVFFG